MGKHKQTEHLTPAQMEAAWKKVSTPTKEHAFLEKFVGNWKGVSRWWINPGAEPQTSVIQTHQAMTLDGKFLKQEFTGDLLGKPFHGIGFIGYDTVASEFTSVWMDSVSTMMTIGTGTYDPEAKTIVLNGETSCPLVKGKRHMRMVLRLTDTNHHAFEIYEPSPDGSGDFKGWEAKYVRVK
jgi:hypothetical protein